MKTGGQISLDLESREPNSVVPKPIEPIKRTRGPIRYRQPRQHPDTVYHPKRLEWLIPGGCCSQAEDHPTKEGWLWCRIHQKEISPEEIQQTIQSRTKAQNMNWYKKSQIDPTAVNASLVEQIRQQNPLMGVIVDPAPGANISTALSPETAVIVSSYPYGRLRCIMRYWRERNKKGTRWVAQTNNPKKPELYWNAPKPSTYNNEGVMILYVAGNGHVQRDDLTIHSFYESGAPEGHAYDGAEQKASEFIAKYGDNVDEIDRATIAQMIAVTKRHQQRQQAMVPPAPATPTVTTATNIPGV